jgi:hypothetical protein
MRIGITLICWLDYKSLPPDNVVKIYACFLKILLHMQENLEKGIKGPSKKKRLLDRLYTQG